MSFNTNFSDFNTAYGAINQSTSRRLQFNDYDNYNTPREPTVTGTNYQNFSEFTTKPPGYAKQQRAFYDRGTGIPKITDTNMTIQDIYRTPFLFIQEHRKNYPNMAKTALKGIYTSSDLSNIFFSDENFKRLQRKIKKAVFDRTNGEFRLEDDQEQRDLLIVMRAVYLEHARYLPGQTVRQVKRLNQKVVDEVLPGMLTEIRQYWGYLKEINKPLDPIMRPINTSNAGRLILPSVTTTFGNQ